MSGSTKTVTVKALTALLSMSAIASIAACTNATTDNGETGVVESHSTGKGCIAAYGGGCGDPPPNLDIPMNGLSTHALAANLLSANYDNSALFVSTPLTPASFASSGLASTLVDRNTRDFLRYTLRCAMVPSQSFHMSGTDGRTGMPWSIDETGRAGLCPEWTGSSADVDCQQRVSACLMAENNPMGVHVAVSLRGPIEINNEPLRQRVPTVATATADTGTEGNDLMASFASCSYGWGTGPDCGWGTPNAIAYVGLCTPGNIIAVGTGGAPYSACGGPRLGSSANDTVIRVCDGIRGCDASTAIAANDDACGLQSYVTFTCPSNAPMVGPRGDKGAFSVMIASYARSSPVQAISAASEVAPMPNTLEYPAPELDVFAIREGAFFGNIFDRESLTWTYTWNPNSGLVQHFRRPPGQFPTQYQNMWSCADAAFPNAWAHLMKRVCTTSSGDCLATPLGVCQQGWCSGSMGDGSFVGCRAPGGAGFSALTTYLHAPGDVLNGL